MKPKTYQTSDHDIDPSFIDPDAIYVTKKLRDAGFSAYLVGGSVRDLLLKQTPKDFDISTSARPEQIKQLFQRQCLIIGKRFRLAHIRFGHKVFEVSTFRSGDNDGDLIVHDNCWGTPEEDALRRDFTLNGLYYDPSTHSIIDYVGGWEDLHQHKLRCIGDPNIRFRQDPVRMIRLLKFQARFPFHIDPATHHALTRYRQEIIKSSPARVLEEVLRMLESGSSAHFFHLMTESGLLELLFPCLTYFLQGKHGNDVYQLLKAADQYNQKSPKKPLDRTVLVSSLLYPILHREVEVKHLNCHEIPTFGQILLLSESIIKGVVTSSFSHFPKRLSMIANFILASQYRLTPLAGKKNPRAKMLFSHDFPLALDFLKLRAAVDPTLQETLSWWIQVTKQKEHR